MSKASNITRNNADALAAMAGKSAKVEARHAACTCGCGGKDSHHKATYTRTLRGLVVHAAPARACGGNVVASATIKTPWGVEAVRAIAYDWCPRYATWELVAKR